MRGSKIEPRNTIYTPPKLSWCLGIKLPLGQALHRQLLRNLQYSLL